MKKATRCQVPSDPLTLSLATTVKTLSWRSAILVCISLLQIQVIFRWKPRPTSSTARSQSQTHQILPQEGKHAVVDGMSRGPSINAKTSTFSPSYPYTIA